MAASREAATAAPADVPATAPVLPALVTEAVVEEAPALRLLDRDHSILAFNERVFDWAVRDDVPLLERLRYLCIVSSNLDEFFEVRFAPHLTAALAQDDKGAYTAASFEALSAKAHGIVARQYALYNDTLMPAFAAQGIRIISHHERDAAQRRWVRDYFEREVRPLLLPVGLDPAHPFPQVANKTLNFIVRLVGADAFGRDNEIAIVRVPRVLPRLIRLPDSVVPAGVRGFVSLSSVMRAHLEDLFPGRDVVEFSQFRVTRHSDLAVDEEDVRNLRTALRQGLRQRNFGQAVRLEVSSWCSDLLRGYLQHHFALPEAAVYRVQGPVNLVRLVQLVDLVNDPALLFAPWTPAWPRRMRDGIPILDQLRERDVLIHQPYESFDGVLAFLREAVADPQVLAIKQTIYRTGSDPELINLLREAVHRGKEVMAVVELKARFDEEANINWAEALEKAGAQVVYGVVGLKTHAKMLLVTRREGDRLRRYGHLSTGNYNPRTARLYTDISYLTADADTTAEMDTVFSHLASQNKLPRLKRLWVAPFHLHRRLLERVEAIGAAAAQGVPGRIVLKMNALTDEPLARALVAAGRRGARIDLIVRGACILPAQVPGATENVRVRSLIGRFLEHSRVFYFGSGDEEELYLSSADWMNRNMLRRVELAWPVSDPVLRQRIIDECLVASLYDDRDAWELRADGTYVHAGNPRTGTGAQDALMARYSRPASGKKSGKDGVQWT
ncbi:polyphosphate kinase 1 [Xylophilus sp.]|uniref:polyphosphate kinase 1 n=1 Tax=Xylophilus sp. TaxID=2653893 RepID=UPI002D7E611C|nr:polyphosphate kinase 1 [Xylophilus sp.]